MLVIENCCIGELGRCYILRRHDNGTKLPGRGRRLSQIIEGGVSAKQIKEMCSSLTTGHGRSSFMVRSCSCIRYDQHVICRMIKGLDQLGRRACDMRVVAIKKLHHV